MCGLVLHAECQIIALPQVFLHSDHDAAMEQKHPVLGTHGAILDPILYQM